MADVVAIAVGIITFALGLIALGVYLVRAVTKILALLRTVQENTKDITDLKVAAATVATELTANGGSSVKDKVTELVDQVADLARAQEKHVELGNERHRRLDEQMRTAAGLAATHDRRMGGRRRRRWFTG